MQDNTSVHDAPILNLPSKELPIHTLTKAELHETALERVHLISKEFTDGFTFLENYPKSVTFFGSARTPETDPFYIKARSIAGRIARELSYSVVSGGGPGIMEGANRGATENNGDSVGLTIELPMGQAINPYIKNNLDFYYFFARKVCLAFSAEAYLFFPGGFGTLDEFFEILMLVQTRKIEKVPIILVGSEFWNVVDTFIRKEMLFRNLIDLEDITLYTITDDEDLIINLIKKAPIRNGITFTAQKFDK